MTLEQAKNVLAASRILTLPNGSLCGREEYLSRDGVESVATLDGVFNADELEAIAVWMREHRG